MAATPLTSLTLNGLSGEVNGNVTTTGAQSYADGLVVASDSTLTGTGTSTTARAQPRERLVS